jgi:hypothetical protein
MSKGHHFVLDGKVYRKTTPAAKALLKSIFKGEAVTLRPEDEIAPVIDLEKIDKESAKEAFLKIEMGE